MSQTEKKTEPEEDDIPESEEGEEITEEEISDDGLEDYEPDGDIITTEALLSSTLMTEEGDTVCTALVNIGRQLEMQNKILVKMLSTLQKRT